MQNMTANWIRNGWDMINLEGVRNNRNTDISDYNCFGYAFGAYSWLLPYDTDEEDENLDPDAGNTQQQVIDEITGQLNLFPDE